MGGTLIFNMVKNRFAGVFYIGKTKNFQILFLHHRGPISEGDEADFPKIQFFGIFQNIDFFRILEINFQYFGNFRKKIKIFGGKIKNVNLVQKKSKYFF